MLAKLWKKVLMFILIVACLFNVVIKLVNNLSLEKELLSSAQYIQDRQEAEKAKEEETKKNENNQKNDANSATNTTNNTASNATNKTTSNKTNVVVVK